MFRVMTAAAALSFLTLSSVDLPAKSTSSAGPKNIYIVVMRDLPVAANASTKPAKGRRLNKQDAAVVRYADSLKTRHDAVLGSVGGARKIYSYAYALNGFAAELNRNQVAKLRSDPNVVAVVPNEIRKMDTLTTPTFLGLDAPNGAWDQAGGASTAGDGVIVGIVDSGIWPENPSFAPPASKVGPPPGWGGICQSGEQFPVKKCNDKLIGARFYNAGYGGNAAIRSIFPYEFLSPRAAEGHGVHTASTAVGNYRVKAEAHGTQIGRISGMAPGARLAVYKVCWGYADEDAAGCPSIDSIAAIDQAVADGVDVINFSVGGTVSNFVDPVELAFLAAADAGVFVATSAGNEGAAGPGTVAHNSPWDMTVAMGTHDRRYEAAVVFESGARFRGSSLNDKGLDSHRLVLAADAAAAGQDAALAALCLPGTLDAGKASGRIVVCDRGENARVEKSQVVQDAGGDGMVLVNTSPNTVDADLHFVPTVHVDDVTGAALKQFMAQHRAAMARLTAGKLITGPEVPAPNVDPDSSRGPAVAGAGDLLKPDILAPGVNVLAAYSPLRDGLDFEFLSGTSMASPHIAGIGALLRQAHPDWSPAAIKSALMTTATNRRNDGASIREASDGSAANPFAYGAGFVQPNAALDPGLVYEAGLLDWLAFVCGTGQACFPPIDAIDPSNLNYPSIAIGDFVGHQTVSRTVTNVGSRAATYTASVNAPAGISVEVKPSTFTIAPGATRTFQIKFARVDSRLDRYAFGALVWSDGEHRVRSPIAIRSGPLSAPAELADTGGMLNYKIGFGYTGPFAAHARGLVPAHAFARTVQDDPFDEINTALSSGVGVTIVEVAVPAATTLARFSLFDADTDGEDDLDLYVFNSAGQFVGGSTTFTSQEEVNLVNPVPDHYLVVIHGFQTDGPSARFTLFSWSLGDHARSNMTLTAPDSATVNAIGIVSLRFSGLSKGVRYLGSVAYEGPQGTPGPTVIRVDR